MKRHQLYRGDFIQRGVTHNGFHALCPADDGRSRDVVVSCDGGESLLRLGDITEFRDEMSTATVPEAALRPARLSLELSQQVRVVPPAPTPERTPPAVVAYVALVALAAVVLAGAIGKYGPSVQGPQLVVAAVLAGFTLAAELLSYRKPTGGSGSVGHIPLLALALVVPAWPAVVAAGLPFLVVAIVH